MRLIERLAIGVALHHVLDHLVNTKGMSPSEAAKLVASAPTSSVGDFVTWVITHAPEIYAVVQMVLAIFGVVIPPLPIPVAAP